MVDTHFTLRTTHVHTHGHTHLIVSNNDYTSVSMTVGTFTSQRPRQCFNISITNDAIIEQTKVFTTRLTLIPDSVTTISTSQIIVDPPETTVQITDNDLSKQWYITVPTCSRAVLINCYPLYYFQIVRTPPFRNIIIYHKTVLGK